MWHVACMPVSSITIRLFGTVPMISPSAFVRVPLRVPTAGITLLLNDEPINVQGSCENTANGEMFQ